MPPCPQVGLLDLNGRDGGLRLRAANMLGLLIRHASSISPSLVDAGACGGDCWLAHLLVGAITAVDGRCSFIGGVFRPH